MSTTLCTLEQFQSFAQTLKPLNSLELHFKPDMIDVHILATGGFVWVSVQYKTTITTPCSICVDTNALIQVKGDSVVMGLDGINLTMKSGKLTYKAPKLVDPGIPKRNKESINVTWPHVIVNLTPGDIKDIISMVDSKSKYDFKLSNGVFSLIDVSNDSVQFDMTLDGIDDTLTYTTRLHGQNLEDVLLTTKHFTGAQLLLGDKCPVEFIYACEWLDVTYLLAPMIEEDV